jgi:hypothetical protein
MRKETAMHKALLVFAFVFIAGAALAENLDMSRFVGLWGVDYERTMEEGKKSPKYDAEKMPAMIKGMMTKMKIRLTDSEMIYVRGAREVKMPYTVTSSDARSVTAGVSQGSQEITLTFILIDGEYMNFKSSGSDDMAYYVWKRESD